MGSSILCSRMEFPSNTVPAEQHASRSIPRTHQQSDARSLDPTAPDREQQAAKLAYKYLYTSDIFLMTVPQMQHPHKPAPGIQARFKRWSQTAYGLLHAVERLKASDFKDASSAQQSISKLVQRFPSQTGFLSAVPQKSLKKDSIKVSLSDGKQSADEIANSLLCMLIADLVVLFDDIAGTQLADKGIACDTMPGGKADLLKSRFPDSRKWAARGVIELVSIRNAIVHNDSTWNDKALNLLSLADVIKLPQPGTPLRVGIDDLFRYRRAVRTALNEIKKLTVSTQSLH